ncbi:hypothetical protein LUZ60_013747 [Juncus effusus]|nr:hypothetical protein LUZ60_013747 [Juncus effusus]
MEVYKQSIEKLQKAEISPVKNLDKSSDSSVRSVLSFVSDSTETDNMPKEEIQFEEEEKEDGSIDRLRVSVQKKLSDLPGEPHKSQPITIFRVPASFRESRKTLYEPKMVSIGPYYHGKEELQAMQDHKWWCLRDFLSRNPEISLETYIQEMRKLAKRARMSYGEKITTNDDDFVLMLLLDGCFILEYFFKFQDKEIDVLCDVGWGGPTIISDLFLLENQIPFFILHKLAFIHSPPEKHRYCEDKCDLINDLFKLLPYQEMLISPEVDCDQIHHLLHLYYLSMMPKSHNNLNHQPFLKRSLSWLWMRIPENSKRKHSSSSVIIPCVAELHDAGVKFKRNSSPRLFDISFNKGVMQMPLLVVDNTIRTIFTNLVAFEQSQIMKSRIFTSYVVLWNMLIDTSTDVSLLEHKGILELVQHNEEQAADFFNELADCWSLDYDDHYYSDLFSEIQRFSSSTWNRSRAKLMQDYFNNPWSSISVVAGVFLLILTVVQTYYTVYPDGNGNCKC